MAAVDLTTYGTGLAEQALAAARQGQGTRQAAALNGNLERGGPLSRTADRAHLEEVAQDFEAVFLSQMFEQMWSSVDVDPLFGGGHAEKVWRSLLNQEYGKALAAGGGVGLADQMVAQLVAAQEAASGGLPGQPPMTPSTTSSTAPNTMSNIMPVTETQP
ncbi:rod-binding protein [Roseospirillum parvum]|uniref:Rod binding protein n=1 Tax=Roseospirillum parvum TaxID=83401 RepID=A0A1G8FUD8_9PROT|nr:rod-binding protein [Roseospirillum parvum]SDH85742.1 Rod binding protein [Roseospirillum parvum]